MDKRGKFYFPPSLSSSYIRIWLVHYTSLSIPGLGLICCSQHLELFTLEYPLHEDPSNLEGHNFLKTAVGSG